MKNIFVVNLLLLAITSFGQTRFDDYQILKCEGEIPEIFLNDIFDLSKNSQEGIIKDTDGYRDKKQKKRFALESSYFLNRMLLNGKVLFGDELSLYLKEVAKNVTSQLPEKDELEFYVVKSSHVNAFTTNEGKIFVSTGLIAQLETEAQLAYVLAHEVAHYLEGHVLQSYIFNKGLNQEDAYHQDGENTLMKKSGFSQEKELEADEKGMEIFNKSKYGNVSLQGVFDILKYAHLPIDEVPFDPSFLETEDFQFRASLITDSVAKIHPIENPEHSTHPGAAERQEAIHKYLVKRKKGKSFLTGKKKFIKMRNIARFELSSIFIRERDYQALVYHNHVLSQDFPNNKYLERTTGFALYYLSKYKIKSSNEVFSDLTYIQGESFKTHYLFDNIDKKDMILVAANYLLKLHDKYPEDAELKDMAFEVVRELNEDHHLSFEDYYKITPKDHILALQRENDSLRAEIANEGTEDSSVEEELSDYEYKRSSKYKNIEKKEKSQIVSVSTTENDSIGEKVFSIDEDVLSLFMFCRRLKDSTFSEDFRSTFVFPKKETKEYYYSEWNRYESGKQNVSSILMADPISLVFDTRKNDVFKIDKSAERTELLKKSFEDAASKHGIKCKSMGMKGLSSLQVKKFNDIKTLNTFISEVDNHSDLDSFAVANQKELTQISEDYNIDHLGRNIFISVVKRDNTTMGTIAYSLIIYPVTPFLIYDALTPDRLNSSVVRVYDIKEGRLLFDRKNKIKGKPYKSVVKANLYEMFEQLNSQKK